MIELYTEQLADLRIHSDPGEEEQDWQHNTDEVQGAMQALPLHARPQGLGQGGQAEAKLTPGYVVKSGIRSISSPEQRLTIMCAGLTITDTPKKNAKGKRAAKGSS